MVTALVPNKFVFICYRRDDSSGSAGRMHDALVAALGEGRVFFDTESVGAGQDFIYATTKAVNDVAIVLVVIGPRWLAVGNSDRLRLQDSDDHVRRELETARVANKRIVPVLVDGATMPGAADLPDDFALACPAQRRAA